MINLEIMLDYFIGVMSAIPQTVLLAITIFLFSIIIGTVMALIQEYNIPFLSQIVKLLKLFMRGTPLIVFILLVYYSLPMVVSFFTSIININFHPTNFPPEIILVVAVSLTLSSFQTETIRASFLSVNHGQVEASKAMGYNSFQSFLKVIVPQALVEAVPEFGSSFLIIMKAISLGYLITVVDIFAQTRLMAAQTSYYIEAFIVAAIMYWIIAYFITFLTNRYENYLLSRT